MTILTILSRSSWFNQFNLISIQQLHLVSVSSDIFRKLGVNNRTQAVLAVQQLAVNNPAALEGLRPG